MTMSESCVFCKRDPALVQRVFYGDDEWFAFLDRKPLATGHTVLVRYARDGVCPKGLSDGHLAGHDRALAEVVEKLRRFYSRGIDAPKDYLFASLRQKDPHVHTHIVPLWQADEDEWRLSSGLKTGSMFRFLGTLEERAAERPLNDTALAALADQAAILRHLETP